MEKLSIRNNLVLIHGGPGGNHTLYSDIEKELLEFTDLVLIDLRGCGLSDPCETKYCTLETHIDDLSVILDELHLAKPIIHGCSYGAILTLGFAIKYPDKISKMILSSGASSYTFLKEAQNRILEIGTQEQIAFANILWDGAFKTLKEFEDYYREMASLYVVNQNSLLPTSAKYNKIGYNFEIVNFAFTTFLKKFDYRPSLTKIKVKTLILQGANDWLISEKQARILHKGIANSRVKIFKNCGHFPWKDQKQQFLTEVRLFLNISMS